MLRAWLYKDLAKHANAMTDETPMLNHWCDFRHGSVARWVIFDGERPVRQTCLKHLMAGCLAVLRECDEPLMHAEPLAR